MLKAENIIRCYSTLSRTIVLKVSTELLQIYWNVNLHMFILSMITIIIIIILKILKSIYRFRFSFNEMTKLVIATKSKHFVQFIMWINLYLDSHIKLTIEESISILIKHRCRINWTHDRLNYRLFGLMFKRTKDYIKDNC